MVLSEHIRRAHRASDETYGMPRIRAELADTGVIARLMRAMRIQGVNRRRAWCATTKRNKSQRPAPDLVKRVFVSQAINELWVADMTYVPTWEGFLYLAVVTDACSRKVVGWAFGVQMTADLVLSALNMALHSRRPESVIHHSDQGSQGGFNRSSQHLQPGGVYGAARRMDEAIDRERRHALSGGTCASARGRAPVLDTDCNRNHQ